MESRLQTTESKIESSLDYTAKTFLKLPIDEDRKNGIKSMISNWKYYASKKLDPELYQEIAETEFTNCVNRAYEYRPKTVLTSDKVLSNQYSGMALVVARIRNVVG
jgi:hypothetical protein